MGILTIAALAAAMTGHPKEPAMSRVPKPVQLAATTCFKSGEQSSGMNKICYYNCLGSQAAITIGAVELCPLTIER